MDISSLLSSLSQEDIEKLKTTAQQFFGSKEEAPQKKEQPAVQSGFDMPFDPKLLTGVAKFSKMLNENDERSDFIMALKPLLSDSRRKKADDAVMMLKFMRIINAMQENGK
ncbi:MAG: hypothetical protein IKL10_11555 [Clostridia bacterium]|nr:hypothetical protein [Clostridia bacterium]